jgi:predicted ArsR family transcriptional regulator
VSQASAQVLEAVADPVRLGLVRYLASRGPASIAELARALGVHANTVRAHAGALERAGVVRRESATPRGRGRPALRFRLHDDTPPPDADLHGLAEVLASAAGRPRGARALSRLRSLGAAWGRRRGGGGRDLVKALRHLGFRARLDGDRVELSACPCPLVAPTHPETVCLLAQGAANGILAGSGRAVRSAEHDPENRSCTLVLG